MATFTYEELDYRYNPYTKQIEQIDANQDAIDWITTRLDINETNIDLKVSSSEILSEINLSTEWVYITWDRIQLNGDCDVQWSFSITDITDAWPLADADYINSNTLSPFITTTNGVYMTSSWIKWYYWWNKTFELDTTSWSAYFAWDIWATNILAWWSIFTSAAWLTWTRDVTISWWNIECSEDVTWKTLSIFWEQIKLSTSWTESLLITQAAWWWSIQFSKSWSGVWVISAQSTWLLVWATWKTFDIRWKLKIPVWTNLY